MPTAIKYRMTFNNIFRFLKEKSSRATLAGSAWHYAFTWKWTLEPNTTPLYENERFKGVKRLLGYC